ncbi:MAG: selenocysteine-specific translation elongation factor [Pseudonocardia sp.]|uniref:selenocysteine-specific translation elongation factor n=1 Tax=unclassified Pseudonocardia TaxID=2619320 RepID=UPI00086C183A|nr:MULTISPECIES: selenocysteine-specific translation elongation factor [unclassified Pseudonocardia]MBN9109208.1 selenocysteine-specific translation elongation factor [Pseudonocardia sp.]ODU12189.1 MAG: selenocysteine-specific translation elongation factor [Pseudonocardia sp. SCN 72-51]ODV01498.1 MAG: selenocysteine-specific translation elongation factor [Pseudonocardia sp. SCN 73-27]
MQVIATAGHVDHGKSTLVRALTGMEPDRYAEERRRGMTIDLGYAWTTLPGGATVAFVDVPGHERFVTTMLAGVGPVPAAMLVVAADEGWMPQSAEHLDALTALGVRHGLLVVTRSDLLDPSLALEEARSHLAGTDLAGVPAVAVSAVTGAGMDELRTALADLAASLPTPDPAADVRLWIDRAFTVRGAGTVVTGTLPAGTLRTDDELDLLGPEGARRVTVRGLQALGEPRDTVPGVARVAVNLRGVAREAVGRGDLLLTPGAFLVGDVVDVRLRDPRGAPADLPSEVSLHIGSAAVPVRVRPLGADTARLRLARPLPLRIGDVVVLRDPGRRRIAAGAAVLDVVPPPLRRRGSGARRAAELATMNPTPDAAAELARRRVVRSADLVAMGVPRSEVAALAVPAAAGWLVDPAVVEPVVTGLGAAVDAHDTTDPLDPGLPTEAARRAADLPDARLIDALLRAADAPGLVHRDGRVSRSVAAGLPAAVRDGLDALRADLEVDPFAAPGADRLAELGLGPREIASLVRAGELLRLADGVVLLAGADDRAVDLLTGLGADELTLSEVRQALGTTRRVAVPLMEHLGRTGRTVRTDSGAHRLRR